MSLAAIKQRIMDSKPSELEHLYVDEADVLRDRFIEDMFNTSFYGETIDTEFQANFTLYATMLLGDQYSPPPEIFTDSSVAIGWIGTHLGICHLTDNVIGDLAGDPDLSHCTHRVRLRSVFAPGCDDAYAPSAVHAALLSVVIVFRALAERWHEEQFGN